MIGACFKGDARSVPENGTGLCHRGVVDHGAGLAGSTAATLKVGTLLSMVREERGWGRVGGVVAEPLPPQTRACATDALGSSPDRFAQEGCHERVIVTGGRGYHLRSSFIRSQFRRRKRVRRASHIRQMRVTW